MRGAFQRKVGVLAITPPEGRRGDDEKQGTVQLVLAPELLWISHRRRFPTLFSDRLARCPPSL